MLQKTFVLLQLIHFIAALVRTCAVNAARYIYFILARPHKWNQIKLVMRGRAQRIARAA